MWNSIRRRHIISVRSSSCFPLAFQLPRYLTKMCTMRTKRTTRRERLFLDYIWYPCTKKKGREDRKTNITLSRNILYVNYSGTLYFLLVCLSWCRMNRANPRETRLTFTMWIRTRVSAQVLRIARATYYAKIFGFAVLHDSAYTRVQTDT